LIALRAHDELSGRSREESSIEGEKRSRIVEMTKDTQREQETSDRGTERAAERCEVRWKRRERGVGPASG
jgi:hypothetical protein